jgi:hypothetical protein
MARNARTAFFPRPVHLTRPALTIRMAKVDRIDDRKDAMFCLTGRMTIDKLETLTFLPGALADHLTPVGADRSAVPR